MAEWKVSGLSAWWADTIKAKEQTPSEQGCEGTLAAAKREQHGLNLIDRTDATTAGQESEYRR